MPGLRQIEVTTPHALDRVAAVQQDVASRDVTPDLADTDRTFLANTLRDLRRSIVNRHAPEQLLHGELHPGNVLITKNGPLFIDFENTTHGAVEYDLGWVPKEVSDRYSHADQGLVGECRGLVLEIANERLPEPDLRRRQRSISPCQMGGPWFQQYEPRTDHHRSRD
jgi:aminoglycoside phosphotransferase (APT) family kinase protein